MANKIKRQTNTQECHVNSSSEEADISIVQKASIKNVFRLTDLSKMNRRSNWSFNIKAKHHKKKCLVSSAKIK